jgi:alanyl aminopeptidase
MADRTLIEWKPEWAEDVDRVVASSNVMFEDTLVSARKIRQEIKSNDDIVNAFDGISYQKGAAILTMFEAWTGPEKFRAGVHAYLEAHRFGNATEADFLQAIQAATQPGVAAAFSSFLDQPGVPVIAVTLDCAGSSASLTLSQKRLLPLGSSGAEPETWRVPVCARAGSGGQAGRGCSLLTEGKGAMPAPGGRCPSWVLANDGELGYYRALYEGDLLRRLIAAADKELTVAERVGVIRDVNALAEAGELPMADALALVPRFSNDPSRQIVQATLRISSDIKDHQVAPDRRANYARFVSKMYGQKARALGFTPKPGEDDDTKLLRRALLGFVALEGQEPDLQAEARRLSLKWLDDPSAVSADMVGDVLEVAGRYGDRALFDRFRAAAKSNPRRRDRARLYSALGSFQDPALLKEAFALTLDPALDYRETDATFFASIGTSAGRAALWEFVQPNFDAIVARMPRETTGQIAYVASGFCDAAKEKEAKSFLSGRVEKLPGGPRNLAQTMESIQLCIASRTAQEPGVGEFLTKY